MIANRFFFRRFYSMRLSISALCPISRPVLAAAFCALLMPQLSSTAFAQVPPPAVLARSWVLIDATSNQILASANAQERVEPASLTKLMTSYIVFEALRDKKISMNQTTLPSDIVKNVARDESRMFLEANKPVTVRSLIYGMIVQSGNDATLALAELVGGNEANFVTMMNNAAQRLGLKHTHYADTNGLPHPQHYTTAGDLATLSTRLIRDFPEYYAIFSTKEFTHNKIRQLNRNRLLWLDSTVDGVKTGHTQAAGYCLIASAKRPMPDAPEMNRRLVTVVMGERKEHDRVQDSLKMLNYGYQAYDTIRLYKEGQIISTPRVYQGLGNTVKAGVLANQIVTVPRGTTDKIKTTVNDAYPLIAPIKRGQTVGTVTISADNKEIAAFPIVAFEDIAQAGIVRRLRDKALLKVKEKWPSRWFSFFTQK